MAKSRKPTANDNRLLSLLERIERLEEEKKALAGDVRDIYAEAKGLGFDPKAMRQMVKERAMDPDVRAAWQAQLQIYRAALGMLDDTPLGAAARRRFTQQPDPPPDGGGDAEPGPGEDPPPDAPAAGPTAEDILTAKAEGAAAQKAGKMVLLNPYAADDPRRAAWDEGWCAAAGSDGMDVPAAFRRAKPKDDKSKGEPGGPPPGGE